MLPTNPLLNATTPAGPHLPAATLRQYAAGTLSLAAQHRVEAHALACPRCADVLEGLLQTAPATTDQALAQLQQRLRRRVQQAPAALPATRTRHRHRLMALQLAAAAALLFGLVAGGWWTWQQRHAAPTTAARPAAGPRATVAAAAPVIAAPASAVATAAQPAKPAVGVVAAARVARPVASHRVVSQPRAGHAAAPMARPAVTDETVAAAAPAAAPASVAPSAPAPPGTPAGVLSEVAVVPAPAAARTAIYDSSVAQRLNGRATGVAVQANTVAAAPAPARVRLDAMPTAPGIAPTPVGGYAAWREKMRREAAEFKPEAPDAPLSGSVQLRVLVGADGKVQEIKVLHGLRADYDAEAQRLVCEGPGWVPGVGGGKRAAQAVEVAIPFQ